MSEQSKIITHYHLFQILSTILDQEDIYKVELKMGLWQYEDKKEKWMESSIYNTRRVIWTNSHVFWFDKFTGLCFRPWWMSYWDLMNMG